MESSMASREMADKVANMVDEGRISVENMENTVMENIKEPKFLELTQTRLDNLKRVIHSMKTARKNILHCGLGDDLEEYYMETFSKIKRDLESINVKVVESGRGRKPLSEELKELTE